MASSVDVTIQFQLFLDQVTARSDVLADKVKRGNIQIIERELNTTLAHFTQVVNYAAQHRINLAPYKDRTYQISLNIERVKEELARRQRPLSQRIMDFLWSVAEPIDGFLRRMGVPPVIMPLLELGQHLGDLIATKFKRLSPPDSRLLLSSPVHPIVLPQETPLGSPVKQPQPSSEHSFLPDYLQCIGECYPPLAKELERPALQNLVTHDPDLASSIVEKWLRTTRLPRSDASDDRPAGIEPPASGL